MAEKNITLEFSRDLLAQKESVNGQAKELLLFSGKAKINVPGADNSIYSFFVLPSWIHDSNWNQSKENVKIEVPEDGKTAITHQTPHYLSNGKRCGWERKTGLIDNTELKSHLDKFKIRDKSLNKDSVLAILAEKKAEIKPPQKTRSAPVPAR